MKNKHLMKLIEIQHRNVDGSVLWEAHNLLNIIHLDGEEFLLRAAFTGGKISSVIPDYYYLGLDNRQLLAKADTMENLIAEPFGGGYTRQQISSAGDFSINIESGDFIATSPIVAFRSTTSNWGPVSNLWITDAADNSGYLISSISLQSPISLITGQSVTMRIGMQLLEC